MSAIKKSAELIDLSHMKAGTMLSHYEYPWQAIPHISEIILELSKSLPASEYREISDGVFVSLSAKIAPSAHICGPCIIGEGTEVRHCAYIRGSALIGSGAVIGNSTELKNCIISDGAALPHYNYVGDSVIGYRAHFGAGALTSNVKSDKTNIVIRAGNEVHLTGLRKFGAVVGNFCELGCGVVLNPGTVLGERVSVYPLVSVRGVVEADHIVKSQNNVVKRI